MKDAGPMPGEGAKPYAAFQMYLDMGETRTLAKVAKKCHKSATIMGRWSSKYKWKERVHAANTIDHQQEADAEAQAKLEAARRRQTRIDQLEEEAWLASREAMLVARQIMRLAQTNQRPSDAARLLQVADSLGRMSQGIAVTRQELTGNNGAPLNQPAAPPIVHVTIHRDEATDRARERFGERPPSRRSRAV